MKTAGRAWLAFMLIGGLIMAGCEREDGGTTDPLPDPTPSGDITVSPDSDGSMDPMQSAVNAANVGNVIVVQPGSYSGTLVIDKPLSFITSAGKDNTILTNETDTTTVIVNIAGSHGSADSLILTGLGFNSGGRGLHVEASTVPVVVRQCDFLDNATVGLQVGDASGKAGGEPELHLWQSFFRRNGRSGTSTEGSAALWTTTTVLGASVFFERNVVDIALTNAALANLQRVTVAETDSVSLFLTGASEMTLDGISSQTPTRFRDGTGWMARVLDSTLNLSDYELQRFDRGGLDLLNSTLMLDRVLVEDMRRYGIRASDSSIQINSCQIMKTAPADFDAPDSLQLGYGVEVRTTNGQIHQLRMTDTMVGDSFRGGVQVYGAGQELDLQSCAFEENGDNWTNFPFIDDPDPPLGGGVGVFDGARATVVDTDFRFNFGFEGGGLAIVGDGSSASIQGGEFRLNAAFLTGAGILVDGGSCSITNGTVRSNSVLAYGGGVAVVNGGQYTAVNTPLESNSAGNGGGGAYLLASTASFSSGSDFLSNSAGSSLLPGEGGGLHLDQSTAELDSALFEGNVSGLGGGLFATLLTQDLVIRNATFRQNETLESAAAVYALDLTRELRLEGCQIYKNAHSFPLPLGPSTIFSQQNLPGGRLAFRGCTIADNRSGSGTIGHESGEMSITETVVAFNLPAGLVGNDLPFVELSCNDFWNNGDLDYGPGADPGPGSFQQDPLFCNRDESLYTVDSTSPLLPQNNTCGVRIGARGQGCVGKQ